MAYEVHLHREADSIRDDVLLVYVVTISTRDNVYELLRRRLGR